MLRGSLILPYGSCHEVFERGGSVVVGMKRRPGPSSQYFTGTVSSEDNGGDEGEHLAHVSGHASLMSSGC